MPRPNPIQRARAIGPSRGVAMSRPASGGGNNIVSITDGGDGLTVITTQGPHGLTVDGTNIVISGNSVPAYNTTIQVYDFTATTMTSDMAYDTDGTGGTWALA